MSDSEFEELTSQVYASKIQKQLKTSKLQMSKLADEKQEMMMKIVELTLAIENNKKQIEAKNTMIQTTTNDEIRLSKKLLILQQQKRQLKQELLKTEKYYQHVIGELLKEKEQLLKINRQLSENLLSLEDGSKKDSVKIEEVRKTFEDENECLKQSLSKMRNQLQLANDKLQQFKLKNDQKTTKINQQKSLIQQLLNELQTLKVKSKQDLQLLNQENKNQIQKFNSKVEKMEHVSGQRQIALKQQDQLIQQMKNKENLLLDQISELTEKHKLSYESLEKQFTQQLKKNSKLQSEHKQELNRLIQKIIQQQQSQTQIQMKLLRQVNQDQQQEIRRLQQLISNANKEQQQIKGQLPIADIIFLIQKFFKINKLNSRKFIKQNIISQKDINSIEHIQGENLMREIKKILPKKLSQYFSKL